MSALLSCKLDMRLFGGWLVGIYGVPIQTRSMSSGYLTGLRECLSTQRNKCFLRRFAFTTTYAL